MHDYDTGKIAYYYGGVSKLLTKPEKNYFINISLTVMALVCIVTGFLLDFKFNAFNAKSPKQNESDGCVGHANSIHWYLLFHRCFQSARKCSWF